jgi:hypothetical protein
MEVGPLDLKRSLGGRIDHPALPRNSETQPQANSTRDFSFQKLWSENAICLEVSNDKSPTGQLTREGRRRLDG